MKGQKMPTLNNLIDWKMKDRPARRKIQAAGVDFDTNYTAEEILDLNIETKHKIQIMAKAKFWTAKQLRLISADIMEEVVGLYTADARPANAIQACRDYANELIPVETLRSARSAAYNASLSATDYARDVAWGCARALAETSSHSAASDCAFVAARASVTAAAEEPTTEAAKRAAYAMAKVATRERQVEILRGYL